MDGDRDNPTTVVCVGGNTINVRGVCALVKRSGYRAIAVITEVDPGYTLPLLDRLLPDAIIVSDDLPDCEAKAFTESLRGLYPDVRILLLEGDHDASKPATVVPASETRNGNVVQKLFELLKATA